MCKTNNTLFLHWAFSVLQQKIQQQIFVFDINTCFLPAPVVAFKGCNTKKKRNVGEGNALVSWYLCIVVFHL